MKGPPKALVGAMNSSIGQPDKLRNVLILRLQLFTCIALEQRMSGLSATLSALELESATPPSCQKISH